MQTLIRLITLVTLARLLAACQPDDQQPSQLQAEFDSHIEQARFFQSQGQLRASMSEVRDAIDLIPDAREPYFVVAHTYLLSGDADRARQAYEELLTIRPETATEDEIARAKLGLARSHLLKGEAGMAANALQNVRTSNANILLELKELKARVFFEKGEVGSARELLLDVLRQAPRYVPAHLTLSKIEYFSGETERARSFLETAMELAPFDHPNWLWKGQMHSLEGEWEPAYEAYRRSLEVVGQYDIMTLEKFQTIREFVKVLQQTGRQAEAETYQAILDSSEPGRTRQQMLKGQEALAAGDFQQAALHFHAVLRQVPLYVDARESLGRIAWLTDDSESLALFWGGLESDQVHPEFRQSFVEARQYLQWQSRVRDLADAFYEPAFTDHPSPEQLRPLLKSAPEMIQQALMNAPAQSQGYRDWLRWLALQPPKEANYGHLEQLLDMDTDLTRHLSLQWETAAHGTTNPELEWSQSPSLLLAAQLFSSDGSEPPGNGRVSMAHLSRLQLLNVTHPQDGPAQLALAEAYLELGEKRRGLKYLGRLVAQYPDYSDAWALILNYDPSANALSPATDSFERQPTTSLFLAIFNIHVGRNDYTAAQALIQRGMERWPAHPLIHEARLRLQATL